MRSNWAIASTQPRPPQLDYHTALPWCHGLKTSARRLGHAALGQQGFEPSAG